MGFKFDDEVDTIIDKKHSTTSQQRTTRSETVRTLGLIYWGTVHDFYIKQKLNISISSNQISEMLGEEGCDWCWVKHYEFANQYPIFQTKTIIFDLGEANIPNEQEEEWSHIELRCSDSEKQKRKLVENILDHNKKQDGEESKTLPKYNVFRQVPKEGEEYGKIVLQFLGVAIIDDVESLIRHKITFKVIDENYPKIIK